MSDAADISKMPHQGRPGSPWVAAGLAVVLLLTGAILALMKPQVLALAWADWCQASGLRRLVVSFALLTGAVVLATASGLAVVCATRALPAWIRRVGACAAKAVAVFPLAALAAALMGFLVGRAGWPIESLAPVPAAEPSAWNHLWKWLLPVILLAVPLAAEFAAFLLRMPLQKRPLALVARGLHGPARFYWHELPRLWLLAGSRLQLLGLLGAVFLLVLEDALDLPGAAQAAAHALRRGSAEVTLSALIGLAIVATAGCLAAWALHRLVCRGVCLPPPAHRPFSQALIEGAVAAGVSRATAWRRHVLPGQTRLALAWLFEMASWVAVVTVLVSAVMGRGPGAELSAAAAVALDDYRVPLAAGMVPALWALSFWLLGRMVAPPSHPQTHG